MRKKSTYADCSDNPIASYHWYRGPGKPVADMDILAPATASTYKYAVHSGANAIYFGYGEFNARAGADNFTASLKEVVSFCHFFNVKAYLALNIIFKDKEINDVVAGLTAGGLVDLNDLLDFLDVVGILGAGEHFRIIGIIPEYLMQ